MNRRPRTDEWTVMNKIRIWQQNCQRYEACQQDIINSCNPEKYGLLLFALELAPSKNSPIFFSGTFHLYVTEFLS
jgi:hypothetical protein